MNFLNNRIYVIKLVKKEEINDFTILLKKINPSILISENININEDLHFVLLKEDRVSFNLSSYLLTMNTMHQEIVLDSFSDIKNIIFNNLKRNDIISLNYSFEELENNMLNFAKGDAKMAYNYCLFLNDKFTDILDKYDKRIKHIKDEVDNCLIEETLDRIKYLKFSLEDEFLDLNILDFKAENLGLTESINEENLLDEIKRIKNFEDKYDKIKQIINHLNLIYTFFDYNIYFVGKISFDLYKNVLGKYQYKLMKSDEVIKDKIKKAIDVVDMKSIQSLNQIHLGHRCDKHYEIDLILKLLEDGYTIGNENNHITLNDIVYKSVAFTVIQNKKLIWPTNVTCMACLASNVGLKPLSSKEVLEHYDDIFNNKDFIEYNYLLKMSNKLKN